MGLWKEFVAACSTNKSKKQSKPGQVLLTNSIDVDSASSDQSSQAAKPRVPLQPAGVNVDFKPANSIPETKPPIQPASRLSTSSSHDRTLQSQVSREGALGPTGVYIPSFGFRTPALLQRMMDKYGIPEGEIRKAMDFAESEEYVDVYCFAYCITGGPMETTAFKTAGLEGMDKEAILASAGAPGMDGLKILTPEEQQRHDKARRDFQVEQALQNEDEADELDTDDPEELVDAYRTRFEDDTSDMTLEEVMVYFGVPEPSKIAIHKALHPDRGAATAGVDEKARRKAAHAVALERYDELVDG